MILPKLLLLTCALPTEAVPAAPERWLHAGNCPWLCPSLTIILRGAHGLLSFTSEKTHVAAVSPALWVELARRKG